MNEILTILIADDNYKIADITKKFIIQDKRFKVIAIAENENQEKHFIKKFKPDLVITDIKKKKGWTGLNIIKEFEEYEYKPIFFVVSGAASSEVKTIIELGISYYLNKPYQPEELMRILNDIYDEKYAKDILKVNNKNIKNKGFLNRFLKK